MNFLAHLALAGPDDASRIGNILGDFEKGTPDSLRERLPSAVVTGIMMHRHLDRYTDSHPLFLTSKNLLKPERRRFAGIAIDIFFDHFLSKHWSNFHPGTTTHFIAEVYQLFERHPEWLGSHFGPLVPRIKSENWLGTYQTITGVEFTLQRIATRSHKFEPLIHSVEDLTSNYLEFENLFLQFYPQIREYAAKLLGKKIENKSAFP